MQMVPVSLQNPSNQLVMVYPGNPGMPHHHGCHHHHKCHKHKKKKKKEEESDSDSDSDTESDYYYVSGSGQQGGDTIYRMVVDGSGDKHLYPVNGGASGGGKQQTSVFAPSHPQAVNQYVRSYKYNAAEKAQPRQDDSALVVPDYYYPAPYRYDRAPYYGGPQEYYYETDPYRPSDAMNEFDDYYCRPNYYDPTVFDCVNEGMYH